MEAKEKSECASPETDDNLLVEVSVFITGLEFSANDKVDFISWDVWDVWVTKPVAESVFVLYSKEDIVTFSELNDVDCTVSPDIGFNVEKVVWITESEWVPLAEVSVIIDWLETEVVSVLAVEVEVNDGVFSPDIWFTLVSENNLLVEVSGFIDTLELETELASVFEVKVETSKPLIVLRFIVEPVFSDAVPVVKPELDPCVILSVVIVVCSFWILVPVWICWLAVDWKVSPVIGETVEPEKAPLVSPDIGFNAEKVVWITESECVPLADVSVIIDWLEEEIVSVLVVEVDTSKPLTVPRFIVEPVFTNVVPKVSPDKLDPCVISLLVVDSVLMFEIVWLNGEVDGTGSPVNGFNVENVVSIAVLEWAPLEIEVSAFIDWLELSVKDEDLEIVVETSKPLLVLNPIVEPVRGVASEEETVESLTPVNS